VSLVYAVLEPLRRLGAPRPLEVGLAALLGALGVAEVLVPFSSRQGSGSVAGALTGVCCVAVLMLQCRRRPLGVLVGFPVVWATIAVLAPTFTLFYGQFLPFEVTVFLVARFGRGRIALAGAALAAACLLGVDLTVRELQEPGEIVFHWTLTLLVWSAGFGLRTFERRAQASTRRAVEAEVGAARAALLAVLEERTRIARELHDIVGHAVSSVVVQAGAAEQALDDADFVAKALADIRATGNDALGEMRRLVTVLRDTDDVPLGPQPTLSGLPALLASPGAPAVQLSIAGSPRPLPAGVDLAAYRIVQEALTNVRRHANATTCAVSVTYEPEAITVEVVDDGRGVLESDGRTGHGLAGMRERAALYGGQVEAGPAPSGGFAVRASLPVTS